MGLAAAAAAMLALTGTAQAALFDRGGGMIYDDALNITWLQDWNYAQTSGYDADGRMNWTDAKAWADNLVYGGYSDWRLPTISPVNGIGFQTDFTNNGSTDYGYAKTGIGWGTASEMGHLYYVTLGNKGFATPNDALPRSFVSQLGSGLSNTGPFTNVQSGDYWSGTEYASNPNYVWFFYPNAGRQGIDDKNFAVSAVAVRPGDVAAPVPEPQTYAMLLLGLGVLTVAGRRRPR
jgi:hypothetical protein